MALSIIFSLLGLGIVLTLLFTLAAYAVPFFIALTFAVWAYDTGAGVIGAGLVGIAAGVVSLFAAQLLFASVQSVPLRISLAICFAAPAAVAGFYAVLGIAGPLVPSASWRVFFASIGAVAVGAVALARLALFAHPPVIPARPGDAQPDPAASTYDRNNQLIAAQASLPRLPAP